MTNKERRILKGLSSQIWSEQYVNLPFNDDIREVVSKLKVVECSLLSIFDDLKKLKNYDYFLILKVENSHYFFDTSRLHEMKPVDGWTAQIEFYQPPLIKITNYNIYVRKDKLKKLESGE